MKRALFFIMGILLLASCGDDDNNPEKEKDYKVRYELSCTDPLSFQIEIEYMEHSTKKIVTKTVDSPYKFEQTLKGSHIIDITATLVKRENVEKDPDGVSLKIYINDALKFEGTEAKTIYKTLGVL